MSVTAGSGFGPLVSGQWLAEHLDGLCVVDVRWYLDGRSGRDAWAAGHIPGALWMDIDADLSEPASPMAGRHPLATPERFAAALGRAGIAAGRPVVAYDDAGGSVAARLWWMLHAIGEPVAVLDGGLAVWPGELHAAEATSELHAAEAMSELHAADAASAAESVGGSVDRAPVPWPTGAFVDASQVALAAESAVFDARSADRYDHGGPVDPRPGHIPGAISAPWQGNLGPDGLFLTPAQLRERFAAAADRPAIAYCGSGVTACHDLLAMHIAGIERTALYPGSWSQWGADESRPAETA